jgi:hypothetical protein
MLCNPKLMFLCAMAVKQQNVPASTPPQVCICVRVHMSESRPNPLKVTRYINQEAAWYR